MVSESCNTGGGKDFLLWRKGGKEGDPFSAAGLFGKGFVQRAEKGRTVKKWPPFSAGKSFDGAGKAMYGLFGRYE